ncbi:hypothetical protein M9H77_33861 [Catharanthus roseus]|uniref:Uncharacterized protein n=1 Tax=Catharanthus roseus TaxID=4058 RepID=A0ACB9ZJI7_CATRO|nr:hypothetical protein M9H77_33861 [Catharanthus roseus]
MLRLQDLWRSSCTRLSSSGIVMCRLAIYYDFSENKTLAEQLEIYDVCSAQKIYNVVAKIKRNRMQGRNTVDEVLCLSAERGYTVFHRNREESNVLSTTCPIRSCGDDSDRKELHSGNSFYRKLEVLKARWKSRPDFLHYLFSKWLNLFAHKFCRVWTSQVLHFGVETTNRVESKHSVLKVWLSTCHGDLDIVFLNIDSLIQGQIAEIKYTLEISKLKEKYGARSNAILKNLSNKVSHLALKKIMDELKKACEMVEESGSNCLHYLRKSHSLPCACELVHRKIGKSSGSFYGLESSSGLGSGPSTREKGRSPRSGRGRGKGRNSSRSSLSSVVKPGCPINAIPLKKCISVHLGIHTKLEECGW